MKRKEAIEHKHIRTTTKNWKALKCANVPLKKGTQVTIKTGGGGGFGQPQKK